MQHLEDPSNVTLSVERLQRCPNGGVSFEGHGLPSQRRLGCLSIAKTGSERLWIWMVSHSCHLATMFSAVAAMFYVSGGEIIISRLRYHYSIYKLSEIKYHQFVDNFRHWMPGELLEYTNHSTFSNVEYSGTFSNIDLQIILCTGYNHSTYYLSLYIF